MRAFGQALSRGGAVPGQAGRRGHVLAAACAMGLAWGAAAQTAPAPNTQRPRIGLVLSGGGARGAAHIGVLEVLEELRVPIDAIAGTSMGALVGGAYASGMTVQAMKQRVLAIRTADIVNDEPPRRDQPERLKRDDRSNFLGPEFGVKGGALNLPKGAISGIGLDALLRGFVGQPRGASFDALPIPLRVVTTDIETGGMHVLASGDLAGALRASISIPGLFAPSEFDGRMLVDGGLTRNLPVDVARRMGVDVVIAVNLGTPLLRRDQVTSVLGVTAQMINILTEQNVRESLAALNGRDILISPALGDFASSDFDHMADIVGAGTAAARLLAPQLSKLSLPPQRYAAHRAAQSPTTAGPAVVIDQIRIAGLARVGAEAVRRLLRTQPGQALDAAVLDADLQRVHGQGDFDHVGYHMKSEAGQRVLVIDVQEKSAGPDYLRFGLSLSNDFAGNAYFQALASYRRTWINSRGGQWRTDIKLGRTNQISSEIFQPLQAGGMLFVAPSIDLEQMPFDVFDGRTRVARFSRQTGQLALDAGAQVGWLGELRLGLYRGRRTYRLDTGAPALDSVDGTLDIGGARLRIGRDRLDSGRFPRDGHALRLDLLASQPSLGARDRYTRWEADYLAAFSHDADTLQLGLHAGGAMGGQALPAYDLFAFGGFLQLSGYRSGQLLGQSLAFGRLVYGRRLRDAPLLEGLFGGVSLEAGRVGSPLLPSSPGGLLTAGSIFFAADTPVGPVYLGFGHARGGNNALYLYLGVP